MKLKEKRKIKQIWYRLRLKELIREQRKIYKALRLHLKALKEGKYTDSAQIIEVIYNHRLNENESCIDWYYNKVYH